MPRLLRPVSLLVGLALLAALCASVGLTELRAALRGAELAGLLRFALLSTAVLTVYALRWRVVLRFLDAPAVPLPALLLARVAGHAAGALLPSAQLGGEPLRVLLLRRHRLDWPTATLGVGLDRLLDMTAGAIIGPLYVAWFLHAGGLSPSAARWILAGMAAGAAALGLLYASLARGGGALDVLVRRGLLPPAAQRAGSTISAFVRSTSFARALAMSFLVEALLLAEFHALTRAFAIDLPLPVIGAALVGLGVSQLAPVPAAVGSLEAAQVGVVTLAGGSAGLGLALGLVVRVREMLWLVIGAAYVYALGLRWASVGTQSSGNASAIEPQG